MKYHSILAAIVMPCLGSGAYGQEAKVIDQLVSGTCNAFAAQLTARAEIRNLIIEKPIESAAICSCADRETKQDSRLADLLTLDNRAFIQSVKNEGVQAYVVGRVLHSVLACFATELNNSLAASKSMK